MLNRNTDWRHVPLPDRMQALPKDARGLPIPFIVTRDSTGRPLFTINDHRKTAQCLREDKCPICGHGLSRGRWFAGGPLSAFHPQGCYIDTPLHKECMIYALQVCPYLAAPKYAGRLDDKQVDYSKMPDTVVMLDPTMLPERPPLFVCVMAVHQKVINKGGLSYVKPARPYKNIEYWRFGSQLGAAEGMQLVDQALAAHTDATLRSKPRVLTRGGTDTADRL